MIGLNSMTDIAKFQAANRASPGRVLAFSVPLKEEPAPVDAERELDARVLTTRVSKMPAEESEMPQAVSARPEPSDVQRWVSMTSLHLRRHAQILRETIRPHLHRRPLRKDKKSRRVGDFFAARQVLCLHHLYLHKARGNVVRYCPSGNQCGQRMAYVTREQVVARCTPLASAYWAAARAVAPLAPAPRTPLPKLRRRLPQVRGDLLRLGHLMQEIATRMEAQDPDPALEAQAPLPDPEPMWSVGFSLMTSKEGQDMIERLQQSMWATVLRQEMMKRFQQSDPDTPRPMPQQQSQALAEVHNVLIALLSAKQAEMDYGPNLNQK